MTGLCHSFYEFLLQVKMLTFGCIIKLLNGFLTVATDKMNTASFDIAMLPEMLLNASSDQDIWFDALSA